jgi:O-antigen/teichoic acid export membrane protein
MENSTPVPPARDGMGNILRNLGWLLGGKGFAAIASLAYLAILSRSLGVRDFGHFSLLFGTAQALVAIAGFETWQSIVRFGARYVVDEDWDGFGRLIWLCALIDIAGAVLGCLAAYAVFYGFNEILDLNPGYVDLGFWFCCALLWGRLSTPNGIVRVLDRFDVQTYVEAIVPAGRLLAALAILFTGPSVTRFVIAWAVIDLLAAAVFWMVAWRLAPRAVTGANLSHWRRSISENEGVLGFLGITYATASLGALTRQGPLLAVGYFIGTSAAGVYRLADQLAQSIGKFAQIITRAVFPEFVHSQIQLDAASFRKLFGQVTKLVGIGGVVVTLGALLFGGMLLGLVGGDDFAAGQPVLLALAIGASFELASVSFAPMFYATGHARYPLLVRAVVVVAITAGIVALSGSGKGLGIAVMVAAGMVLGYVLNGLLAWRTLREIAARS